MRPARWVLAVIVATSAGCLASTGPAGTPTSAASPTPASVGFAASGTSCGVGGWVSFYGLEGEPPLWEPDTVRIGFELEANASALFAAFVDGTVRGVMYAHNDADGPIADDGSPIELDASFSGVHDVQVVAYSDEDGDEALERGVDRPCLVDGEVVAAGPRRADFDRFG